MARRTSAKHRVPGNPLAGVLRQQTQQARSTTRRSVAVPGPEGATGRDGAVGAPGPPGPQGPPGEAGVSGLQAVRRVSDSSGVVSWTFPTPFADVPVVTANAQSANSTPTLVQITSLTATSVAVRVLRPGAVFSQTWTATPNVTVHLHVAPATA